MSGGELTTSTVARLAALLREGSVSAPELLEAHLAVIRADGPPSFDGRPDAVNAWVRLYEEDGAAAAERAQQRLAAALDAGGVVVSEEDGFTILADPDGNKACVNLS